MTTPSGRVLTVGAGQQFSTLNAALAASQDGDTIAVQAGTYTNDISTVTHSVTIAGVGGLAHFQSTGNIANGKAILIDDAANLTLQNLEFSGATVSDGNGAGIRYEAGNLVIKNSYFHDNQEGILGGAVAGGNVTIDGSTFTHNGAGDGQTHGVYVGTINKLTVTNSFFQDQNGGSHVKSRAAYTDIENNKFIDTTNGDTNYEVDLPNGGNDTVAGNVMLKSATPENRALIHFGGELANATGNLTVHDNQLYSQRDPSVLVLNQTTGQPVSIDHNGVETSTISIMVDGNTAGTSVSNTTVLSGSTLPSTTLVVPTALATTQPDAPPVIAAPASATALAGSSTTLTGISISDADGATQSYTVTLTATDGTLSTGGGAGTIAGNGTASLTISGSLANANTDLALLGFTGTAAGTGGVQIQANDGAGGTASQSIAIAVSAQAQPAAQPTAQPSGGHTLTVGAGQQFATLNAAIAASQDGDTIAVQAGTYTNDYTTVTHSVTITGVGGLAHFQSTGLIPNGKAILIDDAANLTIQNLEFSGAQVGDSNGAGIRYEAGNLVVKNSYFHDDQDGILGGAVAGGNVTVDGSTFYHDGAGDGQTHAVYLGHINQLTVTNSFFQDMYDGSDVKSRAAYTLVQNNKFIDHSGATTNYEVDLPEGGNDTVIGNVMVKSAYADNSAFIHFGGEIPNPIGTLLAQNNLFYGERDPTNALLNQSTGQAIQFINNGMTPTTMYNYIAGNSAGVTVTGSYTIDVNNPPDPTLVIPTVTSGSPSSPPQVPADQPPVTTVPGNQTVTDGSTLALTGISIADPDGATQSFTVTLAAVDGLVSTGGGAGTITGNGSAAVTLAGSLANVNADLAALSFKGTAIGAGSLTITSNDGAGGSDSHTIGITVGNAGPVTSVPGNQTVIDGSTLALTGIAIADPDGATQSFTVTLAAIDGIVSTGGSAGTILGNGTGAMSLSGSLAQVNADLAALSFKGTAIGAGSLKIVSSDGAGGSDSHTIGISVLDATPVNSVPGAQSVVKGSSIGLSGISVADADGASQAFTVTLTGTDGTVSTAGTLGTIAGNGTASLTLSGSLASVNADLAKLSFTGTTVGAGSLKIVTSDGVGGTDSDTIAVTVTNPPAHTLMVGTGQAYSTISAALAASSDGDTIVLTPGTYTTGVLTVGHAVTIDGSNGAAHIVAKTGSVSNDGALITTNANVTLQNLDIANAVSAKHSAVAIRGVAGNLTLSNVSVHDSDSAVYDAVAGATVSITGSDFGHNGGGSGKNPVINIGQIADLELAWSKIHDTVGVTEVRSIASQTGLTHDQLIDGTGTPSYALDLPNVGTVIVSYTAFARGTGASNSSLIHLGGGVANPAGYLTVHDSTFTSTASGTHALYNQTLWTSIGFQNDGIGANITQLAIGPAPATQGDYIIQ